MRLLWPAALLLLLLVPLFVVRARRLAPPSLRFPEAAGLRELPRSLRSRLAFLPRALVLAALALAAVALARPQTGITEETGTSLGVDIVLALDISSSMRAEDFAPANRLVAAKEVLEDFIGRRTDDRLGAVAFARNAVTLSPLTLDHGVLTDRLREVDIGDIPDGTAIGNAIAASVNRLDGLRCGEPGHRSAHRRGLERRRNPSVDRRRAGPDPGDPGLYGGRREPAGRTDGCAAAGRLPRCPERARH